MPSEKMRTNNASKQTSCSNTRVNKALYSREKYLKYVTQSITQVLGPIILSPI